MGHADTVRILCEAGADFDQQFRFEEQDVTAYDLAESQQHDHVCQVLRSFGARHHWLVTRRLVTFLARWKRAKNWDTSNNNVRGLFIFVCFLRSSLDNRSSFLSFSDWNPEIHIAFVVDTQLVARLIEKHLTEMRIGDVKNTRPTGEHHLSANVELDQIRILQELLHQRLLVVDVFLHCLNQRFRSRQTFAIS